LIQVIFVIAFIVTVIAKSRKCNFCQFQYFSIN